MSLWSRLNISRILITYKIQSSYISQFAESFNVLYSKSRWKDASEVVSNCTVIWTVCTGRKSVKLSGNVLKIRICYFRIQKSQPYRSRHGVNAKKDQMIKWLKPYLKSRLYLQGKLTWHPRPWPWPRTVYRYRTYVVPTVTGSSRQRPRTMPMTWWFVLEAFQFKARAMAPMTPSPLFSLWLLAYSLRELWTAVLPFNKGRKVNKM